MENTQKVQIVVPKVAFLGTFGTTIENKMLCKIRRSEYPEICKIRHSDIPKLVK